MSVGAYANAPAYYGTGYNQPLYGYNTTGNPGYGLYGNNPWMVNAESPYARMTNQLTPLDANAIPNLASYTQPLFVDMNAFTNNTGIPAYPSFIGAAAMQNPQQPLYTSFNQFLQQNYPQQAYGQQSYGNVGYNPYIQGQGYPQQQQVIYPQQQAYYPQQQYISSPYPAYPTAAASGQLYYGDPNQQLSIQFSAQTPPPQQGFSYVI